MNNGTASYQYNAANQLIEITKGNQHISYQYNGFGERVSQTMNGVTTNYVLDQAAGLTQVLQDGTNTYLYGNGRIAQFSVSDSVYYLTDALGSVRQLVDENGIITLTDSYEPYGEILSSAGTGSSTYGYTGEMQDVSTGLVYLRARYYSYREAHFITRDTWQGDFNSPMSYNAWLYVLANPINFVDPTGQSPYNDPVHNYRDLTAWLYQEMVRDANNPEVKAIRQLNELYNTELGQCNDDPRVVPLGVIISRRIMGNKISNGEIAKVSALGGFFLLVKNGAKWDFKDEIGLQIGPGFTLCASSSCQYDVEYSVPGNIFYGYIGLAAGFSATEIKWGAGWAQKNDPAHKVGDKEYVGPYNGTEDYYSSSDPADWNWGDEKKDNVAVTFGIRLWKKYQDKVTLAQFKSELEGSVARFSKCKPAPESVKPSIASKWPYRVGQFDNRGNPYNLPEGSCE